MSAATYPHGLIPPAPTPRTGGWGRPKSGPVQLSSLPRPTQPEQALPSGVKVSVVVPVRDSAATIGDLLGSLLAQDHDQLEVIVVGGVEDTTWGALRGYHSDSRVRCLALDLEGTGGVRDANAKRCAGLAAATGEVIAVVDSDMVFPAHWLSRCLAVLDQGHQIVAGSMVSVGSDFLSTYVDTNGLAPKTPRFASSFLLSTRRYGTRHKPPVGANLVLRRGVYDRVGGPDPSFTNSYEDYEWARRIVNAGYEVLATEYTAGYHQHPARVGQMIRDYVRSGRGAANYVAKHPGCPLARIRSLQVALVPALIVTFAIALLLATGPTLAFGALGCVALAGVSIVRSRRLVAACYPALTLVLGLAFWWGFISGSLGVRPPSAPLVRSLYDLSQ